MKNLVTLKSFSGGIALTLDDRAEFEELLTEIGTKFSESANFFGSAKMAVSFHGRELTEEEEKRIVDCIHDRSYVEVFCVVGNENDPKSLRFLQAASEDERLKQAALASTCAVYTKVLRSGEILECETGAVLIGDVEPGAAIYAAGDIFIQGGLYGEAAAGVPLSEEEKSSGDSHIVTAFDMAPERLRIDGLTYVPVSKPKWLIKPKLQPKLACVREGKIVIETVGRELFRDFTSFREAL